MRKIIFIIWIIIALISLCFNVYLVLKNKRPIKEMAGSSATGSDLTASCISASKNTGTNDNLVAKGFDWEANAIYKLPKKPGAYVLWEAERVIHVGSADNLYQRIYGHKQKKQMTSFDWYQTKTTDEARQLENELMEFLGFK